MKFGTVYLVIGTQPTLYTIGHFTKVSMEKILVVLLSLSHTASNSTTWHGGVFGIFVFFEKLQYFVRTYYFITTYEVNEVRHMFDFGTSVQSFKNRLRNELLS